MTIYKVYCKNKKSISTTLGMKKKPWDNDNVYCRVDTDDHVVCKANVRHTTFYKSTIAVIINQSNFEGSS